jgi:hypothetical protein
MQSNTVCLGDTNVLEKPASSIYRVEHSSALKVETNDFSETVIPVCPTFQKTVICHQEYFKTVSSPVTA